MILHILGITSWSKHGESRSKPTQDSLEFSRDTAQLIWATLLSDKHIRLKHNCIIVEKTNFIKFHQISMHCNGLLWLLKEVSHAAHSTFNASRKCSSKSACLVRRLADEETICWYVSESMFSMPKNAQPQGFKTRLKPLCWVSYPCAE